MSGKRASRGWRMCFFILIGSEVFSMYIDTGGSLSKRSRGILPHNPKGILRTELRRICSQPFWWALLAGCLLINGWLLLNYAGQRDMVLAATAAEEALGPLDGTTLSEYEERLKLFDSEDENVLTAGQMLEGSLAMAEKLETSDLADSYVGNMRLLGEAEKYAREQFEKLQPVMEKNRENGTANTFFIPCTKGFSELFCRWIPLFVTLEGILCGVLLTIRSVTEPFAAGSAALLLSCLTGRRILAWKRRGGCISGVILCILVWGITLAAAGILFPLGKLWDTPLGSMMFLEGLCPIISRIPMTLVTYLAMQTGISLLVVCLFSLFAGWSALWTRNALTASAGLGVVCMAIYTFVFLFPRDTVLWFLMRCNPVTFAGEAGHWMTNGAVSLSSAGRTAGTLLVWGTLTAVLVLRQSRRFAKADV